MAKDTAPKTLIRLGHREPLDPKRSAMFVAGYIFEKQPRHRLVNRILPRGDYLVMYVLSGHGTYEDALNGSRTLQAGDAIIGFPGLCHSYTPTPLWDEAYFGVRGSMFEQLENEGLLRRDTPILSTGQSPSIVSSIQSLIDGFMQEHPLNNPVQTARAHLLLASMVDAHQAATAPRDSDFLRRACALLENNLHRELDARRIAQEFGFGYERFRKLFAEQTGVSPARYRILRRVDRAKTLLLEGRTPLKSIAEQLGYCDVYFFARQFKQATGKTPGEFRTTNYD